MTKRLPPWQLHKSEEECGNGQVAPPHLPEFGPLTERGHETWEKTTES